MCNKANTLFKKGVGRVSARKKKSESGSVVSDSLQLHGLYKAHGILQARMLEWVAFPFFRGSSQLGDQTQVSRIAGGFFTSQAKRILYQPSQTSQIKNLD